MTVGRFDPVTDVRLPGLKEHRWLRFTIQTLLDQFSYTHIRLYYLEIDVINEWPMMVSSGRRRFLVFAETLFPDNAEPNIGELEMYYAPEASKLRPVGLTPLNATSWLFFRHSGPSQAGLKGEVEAAVKAKLTEHIRLKLNR